MVAFLPILIILIIVAALTTTFMVSSGKIKKSLVPAKAGGWMLIAYSSLLIVAIVVSLFIPGETISTESVDEQDLEQTVEDMHEAVFNAELDDVDPDLILQEWSFDYEKDAVGLDLLSANPDQFSIMVLIEKTNELDDDLKAFYIHSPMYMDGIPIDVETTPEVSILDEEVRVVTPEEQQIRYNVYDHGLSLEPFKEGNDSPFHSSFSMAVLYLQVPEDLEITADISDYEIVR
ncbi:hypothetical protein EQV77_13610 [Halobacillus fulvus]|nr:hypothetical protein EQV77_13610 [Halobacillus fulvus]